MTEEEPAQTLLFLCCFALKKLYFLAKKPPANAEEFYSNFTVAGQLPALSCSNANCVIPAIS